MANSEEIRNFLREHYVTPARRLGDSTVTVRAGDVAKDLNTHMPAVCGVLGSDTFEREMRIKRIAIDGPVPGGTTLFVYKLPG
jgi:5-methylcytosine-specific restriction protein B